MNPTVVASVGVHGSELALRLTLHLGRPIRHLRSSVDSRSTLLGGFHPARSKRPHLRLIHHLYLIGPLFAPRLGLGLHQLRRRLHGQGRSDGAAARFRAVLSVRGLYG